MDIILPPTGYSDGGVQSSKICSRDFYLCSLQCRNLPLTVDKQTECPPRSTGAGMVSERYAALIGSAQIAG